MIIEGVLLAVFAIAEQPIVPYPDPPSFFPVCHEESGELTCYPIDAADKPSWVPANNNIQVERGLVEWRTRVGNGRGRFD
jgi:hypothetical protein